MKALKCSHSAVAVLQLDLPPPEVVAAAGVDDRVHGAVAPAEPGQHREGQLGLGDAGRADACTTSYDIEVVVMNTKCSEKSPTSPF